MSAISGWFIAQFIKALIVLLKSRKKSAREAVVTFAWRTGGMPSSHASLVAAMTTAIAFRKGIDSDLFIVSLFMSLIVLRDALGVRRASGIQGRILNNLGHSMSELLHIEYRPVKEIHGHTPLEVAVGMLLGIFIATAYASL
ncbi:hypothetical protein PilKf_00858 [Pillotina sp. SPG140]